jgi:hypothetical protein
LVTARILWILGSEAWGPLLTLFVDLQLGRFRQLCAHRVSRSAGVSKAQSQNHQRANEVIA